MASDLGVTKVVHTSTGEVYGTVKFVLTTEDRPLQGHSPCSASKIGADQKPCLSTIYLARW